MAQPSDLIAHYSSRIFQTRIYALTMVGAVLAASIELIREVDKSNFVGFLLILIVASLAESNRRYTHSYLCACFASSSRESKSNDVAFWYLFRKMNEGPWSGKSLKSCVSRFVLYWSTYIPGIVAGEYLIFRDCGPVLIGWIGTVLGGGIVLWWMYLAYSPLDPRDYKPEQDSVKSESENIMKNSDDLEKHYPKNKSCWRKHKITPTKIVLHEPRAHNFTNPQKTDWKFEAEIDRKGYVRIDIYTRDTKKGEQSNMLRGKECYPRMFNHFEGSGHPIKGWKGWMIKNNYETIKQAMKNGLTAEQALLEAITAQFWKKWADQHDPKYKMVVEQAKEFPLLRRMKFRVRFEVIEQ